MRTPFHSAVYFPVETAAEGLLLRPARPFQPTKLKDVLGCTGYKGPRRSLKEMEAAIARGGAGKPMIAVDTNVLVRLLTVDDAERTRRADPHPRLAGGGEVGSPSHQGSFPLTL
ncbi:MAG: hypothetical protein AABY65_10595 [Nitrospirota bacterium]